jgi:ATP-dependent DNA helicase RecG
MINRNKIKALIQQGESINIEFKTARNQLNKDVYETVCAFLNRNGGTLLLGVNDSGEIKGIDPDSLVDIRKNFITSLNNPQKISPPAYLSIDEVLIEDQTILHIYVPESSQVHRCNGKIYDRNEDGDLDITNHTRLVGELYQRKQSTYSENKIYPFADIKDLRSDVIDKCRKLAGTWRENHPWLQMDDLELIKSAQLYQVDPETGKTGITLAGILLLGSDNLILSAVPHHRTDLILRKVNRDRYDDRDLVRTNLIDSYERIIAFIQKHLPDPFHLEGTNRISLRDVIFREIASNILIHREYTNAFPAKLIIEYGQVRTENSNKPHGFGLINPDTFTPFPKNPVIGAFFREIHRADELGSGLRKLSRYGQIYGNATPEMEEGDIFRIKVSIPEFANGGQETQDGVQVAQDGVQVAQNGVHDEKKKRLTEIEEQILKKCIDGEAGGRQLLEAVGYTSRTRNFRTAIDHLIQRGLLEMTIPDSPRSKNQKYRLTVSGRNYLSLHS